MSATIVLPFPPSSLSGHAKGHWRKKAAETKALRQLADYETRVLMRADFATFGHGDIKVHIAFIPPSRRGDRSNFPARMKPYLDGIADALGVNDARFLPSYEFCGPKAPGCVRVTLEAA